MPRTPEQKARDKEKREARDFFRQMEKVRRETASWSAEKLRSFLAEQGISVTRQCAQAWAELIKLRGNENTKETA